jgi:hypothetical protein
MYKVEKFIYNGIFVSAPAGGWDQFADYTATFKEWTNDPGIVLCACSDGLDRKIPSCCLHGGDKLPKQDLSHKVLIGEPSVS